MSGLLRGPHIPQSRLRAQVLGWRRHAAAARHYAVPGGYAEYTSERWRRRVPRDESEIVRWTLVPL